MFRWCALILVLLLSLDSPVNARVRTTADAIIVEVDLNNEKEARSAKTPSGTYLLSEDNKCWTYDGYQGVCSSLRSCYPGYQLTDLKNFASLNELSIQGTCQYNKADGSQAYGVCCPPRGTYFNPSFFGDFFGGGNPQFEGGNPKFGVGSFPWLQPAGFSWWRDGGAGSGFPTHPSTPSILADLSAPVDMGSPPTESWESSTEKPTTESWETWTPPTTTPSTTTTPPTTTTSITTTKPSLESGSTTTTTTQQPVITNPPTTDSSNEGAFEDVCGIGPWDDKHSRIVGGFNATPNSWPFMVSMQSNQRHFCGGSLIDSQYILTAAHCIASFTSADVRKLEVVLAMHYTEGDTSAVRKRVSRLVRHRGYKAQTLYNDIAILKLDSPVTFGPNISTVCLPPASISHSEHYGKEATVIGWGSTQFKGPLPEALQQVTVKVQTNKQCRMIYDEFLDSMICAYLPGKDSCQGDDGGPMVMQPAGPGSPWTQVGVVSWGIECAKPPFPGVYTSVAHFIEWINKNRT